MITSAVDRIHQGKYNVFIGDHGTRRINKYDKNIDLLIPSKLLNSSIMQNNVIRLDCKSSGEQNNE